MKFFLVLGLLMAMYTITSTIDFSPVTRTKIICTNGLMMSVGPELAKMSKEYICEQ